MDTNPIIQILSQLAPNSMGNALGSSGMSGIPEYMQMLNNPGFQGGWAHAQGLAKSLPAVSMGGAGMTPSPSMGNNPFGPTGQQMISENMSNPMYNTIMDISSPYEGGALALNDPNKLQAYEDINKQFRPETMAPKTVASDKEMRTKSKKKSPSNSNYNVVAIESSGKNMGSPELLAIYKELKGNNIKKTFAMIRDMEASPSEKEYLFGKLTTDNKNVIILKHQAIKEEKTNSGKLTSFNRDAKYELKVFKTPAEKKAFKDGLYQQQAKVDVSNKFQKYGWSAAGKEAKRLKK